MTGQTPPLFDLAGAGLGPESTGAVPSDEQPADPVLTEEQEAELDRLLDQGQLNRTQALMCIGALSLKREVTTKDGVDSLPTRVGPVIVKRGNLPDNAHFGSWDNEA